MHDLHISLHLLRQRILQRQNLGLTRLHPRERRVLRVQHFVRSGDRDVECEPVTGGCGGLWRDAECGEPGCDGVEGFLGRFHKGFDLSWHAMI